MRDLLRGYAAATFESAAEAGHALRAEKDLEEFLRVLIESEPLHNVLTDTAIPPRARRGVVHDLLEGKAARETDELVSWAVLVEPASDVPAAIFELVELAQQRAQAVQAGLPPAVGEDELLGGRAAVRERIRGYADRLFQEVERREVIDELENEVVLFSRIVESSRELRQALVDPNRPVAQRRALVADLLRGKVHPRTARLVCYVLEAGHVRDLVGTLEWVAGLAAEERGRRVAEVRSAVELDPDEYRRLAAALEANVGRPVELRVQLDRSLLGGMAVTIGDTVIDGSLRHRLDQLRDILVPSSAFQGLETRR
ncbi:MAG: ATP synthase F1 subunit delta [Acidimicrobiales bacterium]|jgi:F-type H+-transporting ATPase subunit delta